ncbi:MAG TPA: type III secretion system export apparatus subunit SctU [Burkholderiaceae bacterium]|jgi:type III secretion protein U
MSGEKSEKPTSKKKRDAREKGQVPVSRDFARLVGMTVVTEATFMSESLWRDAIHSLMELTLKSVGRPFDAALNEVLHAAIQLGLAVVATTALLLIVTAVMSYWGQFGVLIAPELLHPSLDKLSPASNVKQLFSKKKLVEFILASVKSGLAGLLMYLLIRDQLATIVTLAGGTPWDIYSGFITLLHHAFYIIVAPFMVLALIDLAIQKHIHIKSLMMDMEEVKQEYKEMEGDPMIKGKRKQLARELASGEGEATKTKDANAVVVNPTHFAVAMLYDESTPVPIVLAKGRDEVAQAMINAAREAKIPVIRHVWLARTLFATCQEDNPVPKASYDAVAHVYAVVMELYRNNEMDRHVELESDGVSPHLDAD